jgi:hypothetical protein
MIGASLLIPASTPQPEIGRGREKVGAENIWEGLLVGQFGDAVAHADDGFGGPGRAGGGFDPVGVELGGGFGCGEIGKGLEGRGELARAVCGFGFVGGGDFGVSEDDAAGFGFGETFAGSGRDHAPLLLGEGGPDVQHERVGIDAKLGDDEGDALGHQARNEVDVAGEAIELCDADRAFSPAGVGHGGRELRASGQRIGAFAAFDLDVFLDNLKAFGRGEAGEVIALGFKAEAGFALPFGGHAEVADHGFHSVNMPQHVINSQVARRGDG